MYNKSDECVVLLNDKLVPEGQADKRFVHNMDTPLHLAFSCYILNQEDKVLITRRSLKKIAWPGVWTNSVCGHPLPDEKMVEAVKRRARFELGFNSLEEIQLVLPEFQYCERDASGIVENEFCPVYQAVVQCEPSINPDEVMDFQWVNKDDLHRSVRSTPWAFSPWMVKQLEQMTQMTRN
ncbi:isopentenyl-diphosphate Delta-isomerase [Vibrio salinus]|uniref:isopentenyl-diphosphate Delta-isomerase n=1 Tax=Vibrio salinus TaxID=2899784 RepID=UPI001E30E65C|nr:isopentenyl-diphosphate Delta-isomerase [Vibrio salinus]MCE0494919.1 isopentenyl-diphosphate Delta-isomerase [Vibrio salinus]